MSPQSHLQGRRYICLARCSTAQQADTSNPDQLKLLRAFGDEQQMQYVDSVILDGVTGSVPGARTDIAQIIARKNEKNDFDVLLVQDMSRFTRSGAGHGMTMEYALNAVGIDVIFVADHLPEGDHSGIIKTVGFYAAQQYAKSLSFAVARGSMS
ncbi:MAG TPA: recombinase family protein, partial [Tepidisphaeraceae bacterium]